MSVQLTDKQRDLLSAAAQSDDRLLFPPPGLRGGGLIKMVAKLMDAGLVREIPTEDKAMVWRRDNMTKRTFALKLTAAGVKACSATAKANDEARTSKSGDPKKKPQRASNAAVKRSVGSDAQGPREGSKISRVVDLLRQEKGATIDELVKATGWLPHTTRAALTGLRRKGFKIERRDRESGPRSYAIAATESA
jgi:hypothetical protein